MKRKQWNGLSETTKRNLCMVPAVMILAAIWLSETLHPAKPLPVGKFNLEVGVATNFVAQTR